MNSSFHLHPQLKKDSIHIQDFTLCQLRIINDRRFPWCVLVPKIANIKEIWDLNQQQQLLLYTESMTVVKLLETQFNPDKINIASIGNVVPQLHIHHIARYESDSAWPKPVWGFEKAVSYTKEQQQEIVARLQGFLAIN